MKKKSKQEGVHEGPAGAERKTEQELRDRIPGPGDCRTGQVARYGNRIQVFERSQRIKNSFILRFKRRKN